MKLWYDKPSEIWTDALPLGNGRMGAMIFGGTAQERIALNEDTLWTGPPPPWDNPESLAILPAARQAALEGRYADADALCRQMQGANTQSYLPLGDLMLTFPDGDVVDYYRDLCLDSASTIVQYTRNGVNYRRECFVSAVDGVLVMRLTADQPGALDLSVCFTSQLRHTLAVSTIARRLTLTGRGPVHADPNYIPVQNPVLYADESGVQFAALCQITLDGGTIAANDAADALVITGANSVLLTVASATDFSGWEPPTRPDPVSQAEILLENAAPYTFETLQERHEADHQALYRRVALDLGSDPTADLPTDERIRQFHTTNDPSLAALLFQYGRYLLITSSRPGTQPANLQGIWNQELRPPWSSNYTLNINAEMNYWPAETANLSECHQPLLDFTRRLSIHGETTARVHYGCSGWTAHHNSDIWGHTAPVGYGKGSPSWSNWPLGSGWLCEHLWERFRFTDDVAYLKNDAYPVMRRAAEFYLEWLIEGENGFLVTAPSTSPEHLFFLPDGNKVSTSVATTMDMTIIRELFTNCLAAVRALDVDDPITARIEAALPRLFPYQIGSEGQLLEFYKEFPDEDRHHRHVSHLYGLYPGNAITPDTTPELCAAVRRSLEIRGDAGTGWSLGWKMNLWARLRDGDHAYALVRSLLTLVDTRETTYHGGGGVYANLMDAHPPFQIDGNFAFTSGVVEMLLQSQNDELHLLPALPTHWHTGSATGLRARNGFTVDLTWANGKLETATIHSTLGKPCHVRYEDQRTDISIAAGESTVYQV